MSNKRSRTSHNGYRARTFVRGGHATRHLLVKQCNVSLKKKSLNEFLVNEKNPYNKSH